MQSFSLNLCRHYSFEACHRRFGMEILEGEDYFKNPVRAYRIGDRVLFDQQRLKAEHLARHSAFERYLGFSMRRTGEGFEGFLLFERTREPKLQEILSRLSRTAQLRLLSLLAHQLESLHDLEIWHGALAENCHYHNTLHQPLIAEPLGGILANGEATDRHTAAADIRHFADLLALIKKPTREVLDLIAACRAEEPEQRPVAGTLCEALSDLAEGLGKQRADLWLERLRAGVRLTGLCLCLMAGGWYLEDRHRKQAEAASVANHLRLRQMLDEERRCNFLRWGFPHPYFAGEALSLNLFADCLSLRYETEVRVATELSDRMLTMTGEPRAWYDILEINQLNWEVNEHEKIEIFAASSGTADGIGPRPGSR